MRNEFPTKKMLYIKILSILLVLVLMALLYGNNFYFRNKMIDHAQIDKIEIFKKDRILLAYHREKDKLIILKKYKIALGRNPIGPKEQQGDNKTPEGPYTIKRKNSNSSFYLSLEISYPNKQDKLRAQKKGVHPGNNIMIHGIMNGLGWIGKTHLLTDWTKGCIALTNEEIKEIFDNTPVGTPVIIYP